MLNSGFEYVCKSCLKRVHGGENDGKVPAPAHHARHLTQSSASMASLMLHSRQEPSRCAEVSTPKMRFPKQITQANQLRSHIISTGTVSQQTARSDRCAEGVLLFGVLSGFRCTEKWCKVYSDGLWPQKRKSSKQKRPTNPFFHVRKGTVVQMEWGQKWTLVSPPNSSPPKKQGRY